jgi:hypothetical protein
LTNKNKFRKVIFTDNKKLNLRAIMSKQSDLNQVNTDFTNNTVIDNPQTNDNGGALPIQDSPTLNSLANEDMISQKSSNLNPIEESEADPTLNIIIDSSTNLLASDLLTPPLSSQNIENDSPANETGAPGISPSEASNNLELLDIREVSKTEISGDSGNNSPNVTGNDTQNPEQVSPIVDNNESSIIGQESQTACCVPWFCY